MQTEQSRLQYLIVQYADNLCTKEEMSELFSLIGDPARDAKFNQEFLKIWNQIHPEDQLNSIDENRLFRDIEEKTSLPSLRRPSFIWAKAAAVLLLVLGGALIYFYLNSPVEKKKQPLVAANKVAPSSHSLIKLPDGSSVLLNNNSSLDYAAFTGDKREVILSG